MRTHFAGYKVLQTMWPHSVSSVNSKVLERVEGAPNQTLVSALCYSTGLSSNQSIFKGP